MGEEFYLRLVLFKIIFLMFLWGWIYIRCLVKICLINCFKFFSFVYGLGFRGLIEVKEVEIIRELFCGGVLSIGWRFEILGYFFFFDFESR